MGRLMGKGKVEGVAEERWWTPRALYTRAFVTSRPDPTAVWKQADWDRYHSSQRFVDALFCYLGAPSHILWNVRWPLLSVVLANCLCILYGIKVVTWGLPSWQNGDDYRLSFQLCSFALSLILSFRVKVGYDRWWAARQQFGNLRTGACTLACMARNYLHRKHPALAEEFMRWGVVWLYAIKQTVDYAPQLDAPAAALLSEEELAVCTTSHKPRQLAAFKMQHLLAEAEPHIPHSVMLAMQEQWGMAFRAAGDIGRLRHQPGPVGVAMLSTGFAFIWLLLLNLTYTDGASVDSFAILLPGFFVALLILGVDEVASQLEDPWRLLPIQGLVDIGMKDMQA
ncbi:hypothetical protein COHA_009076 [Chlorella ohadii]|uniref:Uncharacterized protein n=1 Tax=Chlorella ohadii TaxID=2649997 RepID=A0AAD5H0Z7_9CHLO|nr:hypothetical protein COHA_009076 [Chlorella ohadii]